MRCGAMPTVSDAAVVMKAHRGRDKWPFRGPCCLPACLHPASKQQGQRLRQRRLVHRRAPAAVSFAACLRTRQLPLYRYMPIRRQSTRNASAAREARGRCQHSMHSVQSLLSSSSSSSSSTTKRQEGGLQAGWRAATAGGHWIAASLQRHHLIIMTIIAFLSKHPRVLHPLLLQQAA